MQNLSIFITFNSSLSFTASKVGNIKKRETDTLGDEVGNFYLFKELVGSRPSLNSTSVLP